MDSAGMMKMATGDGFPLRQGAGTGSREVFGVYRGLRRQNSRSILIFDVLGYVGLYRQKKSVGGASRGPRDRVARPGGLGAPSYLLASSKLPWLVLHVSQIMFVPKITPPRFHSVWTPFDIPFLRNTETGNKTAIWAGPPVNRLVPKVI